MNFNFNTASSLIGLDIHPQGIWLVQIKKQKQDYLVEQALHYPFSSEIFMEDKIKQWSALTEILLELITAINIRTSPTAIQLSSNLVRRQRISVPKGMSTAQVQAEIYAYVERDSASFANEWCIDFTEIRKKATGYNDIYFAATQQNYLAKYVNCVQQTGLQVKLVDIDIYALKRAYDYITAKSILDQKTTLIIHERDSRVTFLLCHQHDILFAEEWNLESCEDFANQLQAKIQFYLTTFHQEKIQQVIIGSLNEEFALTTKTLAEEFSLPVCCPDPGGKFKLSPHIDIQMYHSKAFEFMIACGLAMREIPPW